MNEAPLLYKLQIIDLDIEEKTQALQNVESQMGETEELIAARTSLEDAKERLHGVEKSLKETEWEIQRVDSKLKPEETKLYGGTVKNSKELASLEKEVESLRESKRKVEDQELELMSEAETLQQVFKKQQEAFAAVEAAWKEQQGVLLAEKNQISEHLQQMEQARESLAGKINKGTLQTYESLRRMRRGRAVATIERNTCQGCRVGLPMQEVARARTSHHLSFCSSCGRILYVTR